MFNDKQPLVSTLYKKGMSDQTALLDSASNEDDLMLAATDSDIMMIETWIDKDFSIATASLGLIIAGQTLFGPLRVGSHRFMEQESLILPEALQPVQAESYELGYSLVYVAVPKMGMRRALSRRIGAVVRARFILYGAARPSAA